jgi:DNA-binding response OmpR family regulator
MDKQKILIVDDEIHILELLRYNLESNGFEVVESETGDFHVEIGQDRCYDSGFDASRNGWNRCLEIG